LSAVEQITDGVGRIFNERACGKCHTEGAIAGVQIERRIGTFTAGGIFDPANGLGDTIATTRQMRTSPLWGLRFRNRLLHDGRCSDVACTVRAHDGQGAAARNAFNALSSANQHNLVQFVRSL
jgi:CxxC motif-containing protein (DUF1111 family)